MSLHQIVLKFIIIKVCQYISSICLSVLEWYLLGVKGLSHAQIQLVSVGV